MSWQHLTTFDLTDKMPELDLLLDDADWTMRLQSRPGVHINEVAFRVHPNDAPRIESQIDEAREYIESLDDERREQLAETISDLREGAV